jgi:hypothetical protein
LIHVDTDKGELLVNSRFAYVSISRGKYDAEIYTNDKSELGRDLSRDVSQRTATGSQEQEPVAQKIKPVDPNQEALQPRHDQAHIGHEIAM